MGELDVREEEVMMGKMVGDFAGKENEKTLKRMYEKNELFEIWGDLGGIYGE